MLNRLTLGLAAILLSLAALVGCTPTHRGPTDEEIEQTRLEAIKFDEDMAKCLQVPSHPTELQVESMLKAEGLFAAWQHALHQVQEPCNLKTYTFVQDPDRTKDFPVASQVNVDVEILRKQVEAVELVYVRSLADIVFFEGQYPNLAYFCGTDSICKIADRGQLAKSLQSMIRDWKFDLNTIRPGLTLESIEAQRQMGIAESVNVWKGMSSQDTTPFSKDELMNYLCVRFGADINARFSDSLRCP